MFAAVVVGAAGCQRGPAAKEKKFDAEQLAAYADLPGLKKTHNRELQNELARLISEQATPAQLLHPVSFVDSSPLESEAGQPPSASGIPDEQNAATALTAVFAPKLLSAIARRCDELFPADEFQFDALQIEQVVEFRTRYEQQRQAIHEALARPDCDFGLQHTAGLGADLSFLDVARVAMRLEAFAAAEALREKRMSDVVESLGFMFRVAAFLDDEQSVAVRMEAARIRIDTLRVLEAAAQHPAADADLHARLYELVVGSLTQWPNDAAAWVGDRALGLHTYELVRDGFVLSLLEDDELTRLAEDRQIMAFVNAVQKNVDSDELFYLQSMRSIIRSCKQPYYRRKAVFVQIRDRLKQRTATDVEPLVAENILLPNVEQGHITQARDRSLCEGWAIALAAAQAKPLPDFQISPLSGEPYQVVRQQTRLVVRGAGQSGVDRPIIVPVTRRGPAEQAQLPDMRARL